MTSRSLLSRPAARVALGVAVVLAVPLVAMALGGDVAWSVADFVLAGILLAVVGAVAELAVRRAGSLLVAAGVAALGILCGVAGEADDAPGLVLVGLLLVTGAGALGLRARRRA